MYISYREGGDIRVRDALAARVYGVAYREVPGVVYTYHMYIRIRIYIHTCK